MAPRGSKQRGHVRRRGNSWQVLLYAGVDPVTGKELRLTGSESSEAAAYRLLDKFRAQLTEQRHAKTKATFRAAMEAFLGLHEVEASTRTSYETYARLYLYPAFGDEPVGRINAHVLESLYAQLRRCRSLCDRRPFIEHRTDEPHECREVRHRRPPGRMPRAGHPPHDCTEVGCKVVECRPHECKPLSAATIRRIHFAVSGVLAAAVRWEWITSNPAAVTRKPRQPTPEPDPPSVDEVGRIVDAAWAEDFMWGLLVWLVMVTGVRRAEVLGLRWRHIDFDKDTITVRRNYLGKGVDKDTKTHRMRRVAIDPATTELLREHRRAYEARGAELHVEPTTDAFLFSYRPTYDRACDPSGVTHRYERMCRKLGIDSHLHALRHYSVTELLAAGVELPAVAGRHGHGGGGATTLRIYAAWVQASDRKAAGILGGRHRSPR